MSSKRTRVYHLFLILALLDICLLFSIQGVSLLGESKISSGISRYAIVSSGIIVLTWLLYFLGRHRIQSLLVLKIHLIWTAVWALPVALFIFFTMPPFPRRYIEIETDNISTFFGEARMMAWGVLPFLIAGFAFFVVTIRRKPASPPTPLNHIGT